MEKIYDVIILGSGPAGLTAAIYTQRFGLDTLLIAGRTWGGQLQLTTEVENWPGTRRIMGPVLMKNMRDHVADLGVEIFDLNFTKLTIPDLDSGNQAVKPYQDSRKPFTVTAEDKTFVGKTVIVATGEDTKWLGVPGEERLRGRGISSCAPCDAFFFKGKPVAVVGGGDSAMEETHVIANVASDVILIHRKDEFRAQQAMIDKVKAMKNVRFLFNTVVVDVIGETSLTGVLLKTESVSPKQRVSSFKELVASFEGTLRQAQGEVGGTWELPRAGLFVAIGHVPNTSVFQGPVSPDASQGGLTLDSHGYVKREEDRDPNGALKYFTKTNIPGVFTAGDVHDARYKQAVTAAAFGCMAALDVQRWLSEYK